MSHRTLMTDDGVAVGHSHSGWDYSVADRAIWQAATLAGYPGIQTVDYVHLDHTSEELGPTRRYNCWGFTFNPRQCWISSGYDVQNILTANGTQVYPPMLRVGDVVCYRHDGTITHTGRVWSVDGYGNATLVQSKWGGLGEYLHPPLTVPAIYGTDITYWRATPLHGKGDAWLSDNVSDDRLPCPPGVTNLSPDVWCSASADTVHEDPVRGVANALYSRLHNPDTLPIVNGCVRFYWAAQGSELAHEDWHEIGSATVDVDPGGTSTVGPVAWLPTGDVPAAASLLAIAETGDDPFTGATLDPIVWPYDVLRDNNIVRRDVTLKSTYKVHVVDKYNYALAGRRGGAPSSVQLWGDATIRLTVKWVADDVAMPPPELADDLESATVSFHYRALPNLIDMLRNEHPVKVTINNQPPGFVFVHAGLEPVGPGDEDS